VNLTSVIKYLLPRLLFFVAGALLILLARGWQFDFEERTFKPTGILDIRSTPRGATVYLNSDQRGQTPLNLTGLQPDTYQLTIAKSGYYPWQDQITIQPELVSRVTEVVLFPIEPTTELVDLPAHERIFQHPDGDKWLLWHAEAQTGAREIEFVNMAGISLWRAALPEALPDEERLRVVFPYHDSNLALLGWRDETDSRWEEVILLDVRQKELIALSTLIEPERLAEIPSPLVFYPETRRLLLLDQTFALKALDPVSGNLETLLQFDDWAMPLFTRPARFLGRPTLFYLASLAEEGEEGAENRYGLFWREMPSGNRGQLWDFYLSALENFQLSPDGTSLFWQNAEGAGVVLHFANEQRRAVAFEEPLATALGWASSSEKFLFLTSENKLAYFDEARGGVVRPYTPDEGEHLSQACWHPGNQHIFFLSTMGEKVTLKVIEKEGKNRIDLLKFEQPSVLGITEVIMDLPLICESEESVLVPVWREELVVTEESADTLSEEAENEGEGVEEFDQTEEGEDSVEAVPREPTVIIRRDYLRVGLK